MEFKVANTKMRGASKSSQRDEENNVLSRENVLFSNSTREAVE